MCLHSAEGGNQPYCMVFVGSVLRKDARKSAAEFFLFADKHCAIGKIVGDTAERKRCGMRQ